MSQQEQLSMAKQVYWILERAGVKPFEAVTNRMILNACQLFINGEVDAEFLLTTTRKINLLARYAYS